MAADCAGSGNKVALDFNMGDREILLEGVLDLNQQAV